MKEMSVRNYLKIINRQAVSIYRLITFSPEQFPQKSHGLWQGRIFFCTNVQETKHATFMPVLDDVREKKSFFVRAYFLNYLKTDPKYKNLIYTPEVPIKESSSEFIKHLQNYLDKQVITPPLRNISEGDLKKLSFDELLDLTYLTLKCYRQCKNKTLWRSLIELLDKELTYRSLQSEEILKCLSIIREFGSLTAFTFYSSSSWKLLSRVKNLPKEQVVLYLYLVIKIGSSKLKDKKFNLFSKILEIVPDLTLEELAIVLSGTSVLSCKFNIPEIVPAILKNIENNIEKLDSVLLKVLSEGLEEQSMSKHTALYDNFQAKMIPHVSKFHPSSLVCLLLMNNFNNQINVALAENVFKVVRENVGLCSEGILEKIMCVSSYYNIIDEELINKLIKELEFMINHFEKVTFQKCILQFLNHLADIQMYPDSLLRYAMNPKFIANLISEHKNMSINYWEFLNCCLQIENPKYHCAITDEQIGKKIYRARMYFPRIPLRAAPNSYQSKQQSFFYTVNYSIESSLKEIYGEDKVLWFAPLSHYQEIILMIFGRDLKPQTIPENFRVVKSHQQKVIEPLDDDRFWVSFILVSVFNFVRRNNELTYHTQTQIRQFTKVGYKPILVILNEFNAHQKNNTVGKYLTQLVDENLKQLTEQKTLQL